MNHKEFTDALKNRGLTKKEMGLIEKNFLQDRADISKNFSHFYSEKHPNRITPKIFIARTESLSGEVHVLGFINLHKIENIKIPFKGEEFPLLLLRLFVSTGTPPEFFRYTGAEPVFAIDLSVPDMRGFPIRISEERITLKYDSLRALLTPLTPPNVPLELYSVRSATPEERKNIFALYEVKARDAEEYNPKKTKQNPKGAGRKPQDEKKDDEVLAHWEKERDIDGKLSKKQFWEDYYSEAMTHRALKDTINRAQKRRNRRLHPKR